MALSSGVYGLIGVAVGGGVTWVTQWTLAARTDRLDSRVARRKVCAELRRHREVIASVSGSAPRNQEEEDDLLDSLRRLGSKAWDEHSNRLARQLPDRDWDAVERAYSLVPEIFSIWHKEHEPPYVQDLQPTLEQIDDALKRLS